METITSQAPCFSLFPLLISFSPSHLFRLLEPDPFVPFLPLCPRKQRLGQPHWFFCCSQITSFEEVFVRSSSLLGRKWNTILTFELGLRASWRPHPSPTVDVCAVTVPLCGDSLLLCQVLHNKVPETEWLKQQTLIVSQFWRLEAPNQDVGSVGSFWGL